MAKAVKKASKSKTLDSVNEVVEFFGGRSKLAEAMTRAGHPITANAITMWKVEGRIPSSRHYTMDRIVRKRGGRINPKLLGERAAA